MNELLVMRHAKSAWDTGAIDYDRPLNGRGERAAEQMARWVLDNDLVPDRVVASAAARTRATAQAVVDECGIDRSAVEFDPDLYLADAAGWLGRIRGATCERLLVCGHNPGLDDLVEYLSATPPPMTPDFKLMTTAAIAHFRFDVAWSDVAAGSGELLDLARPRELT